MKTLLYLVAAFVIGVAISLPLRWLVNKIIEGACKDCPYVKHCRELEENGKLNECEKEIINRSSKEIDI